ncbi:30S ribosomal protein S17e, partial [archaeon]
FEHNKFTLQKVVDIPSKNVRNRVAGYITRLVRLEMRRRGQVRGKAF